MRGVHAHTSSRPLLDAGDDEEEEEADAAAAMGVGEDVKHPLTPLGSVSSFTSANDISWPKLTRWTCKQPHKHADQNNVRARILRPTLGNAVCDRNKNRGSRGFTFITTTKTVQAGMWRYSCTVSESNWVDRLTLSSWFCIELQHIPHALASDDIRLMRDTEPTRLAYGRFKAAAAGLAQGRRRSLPRPLYALHAGRVQCNGATRVRRHHSATSPHAQRRPVYHRIHQSQTHQDAGRSRTSYRHHATPACSHCRTIRCDAFAKMKHTLTYICMIATIHLYAHVRLCMQSQVCLLIIINRLVSCVLLAFVI